MPFPANAPATRSRVSDQLTNPQNFVVQLDRGRRVVRDLEGLHRAQLDQPSKLRARFAPFEQPLGASEPTQCHRETVAHRVVEDQIDGQARGAAFFATGDAIRERALAELDTCVPLADPHRCLRGPLEIIEIERRRCVGEPVPLEGGDPIAALERRPSIGQHGHRRSAGDSIHALILTLRGQASKTDRKRPRARGISESRPTRRSVCPPIDRTERQHQDSRRARNRRTGTVGGRSRSLA